MNVSQVGGVAAETIAKNATSVAAATDAATAGTLVRRDASGAFSGALVGNATSASSATYALGNSAGSVDLASNLTIPTGGNSLTVTGNGSLVALSAMPRGTQVMITFAGTVTISHSTSLGLRDSVPHVTVPGEMMTFFSLGGGDWLEVGRVTARSRVFVTAGGTPTTVINNVGNTLLVLKNPVDDALGEYNAQTGVFASKRDGDFEISASILFRNIGAGPFLDGEYCELTLATGGALYVSFGGRFSTVYCQSSISLTVHLTVGQTVVVYGTTNSTTSKSMHDDLAGTRYSWMSIHQL